jgi:hypothetical protein
MRGPESNEIGENDEVPVFILIIEAGTLKYSNMCLGTNPENFNEEKV